ncbi:MAG: N-acetyltransferase [Epsilonproteobacteria bacterium]|nr:MAG: N-acetyltransferase [Campylobacterota bacterium]
MNDLIYFKPTVLDIQNMQELVYEDVENGNILDRNSNEMATTIRSYIVVKTKENNEIIGFVALHIHTIELAEIRSLVVKKEYRKSGIAKILIQKAIDEAKEINLKRLLVLTYKKELFELFDFVEIPKESIPETKIWADCIKCKHFPICDEISLTLDI